MWSTKLNSIATASPSTSTLHSCTFTVYISVSSLPPSTRLCLSASPLCPPASISLLFPHPLQWAESYLPSLLTHPFCTLANPKLCPLHLCSISGFLAEHWDARANSRSIQSAQIKAYKNTWQVTEPMTVFILKVNKAPCLVFQCVCCFSRVAICVCASRGSPPPGGGVPTSSLTCLCWPDVNQLVPRLFSLAEYGSAGERSRRAKKRNIGRYTWSITIITIVIIIAEYAHLGRPFSRHRFHRCTPHSLRQWHNSPATKCRAFIFCIDNKVNWTKRIIPYTLFL